MKRVHLVGALSMLLMLAIASPALAQVKRQRATTKSYRSKTLKAKLKPNRNPKMATKKDKRNSAFLRRKRYSSAIEKAFEEESDPSIPGNYHTRLSFTNKDCTMTVVEGHNVKRIRLGQVKVEFVPQKSIKFTCRNGSKCIESSVAGVKGNTSSITMAVREGSASDALRQLNLLINSCRSKRDNYELRGR